MKYQRIKDGKAEDLPIHFSRAQGVEEVYAHGAAGGPVANYHFRIDFYKDEFPPVEFTAIGSQVVEEDNLTVERKIVASVCVPLPFLKELRNWLVVCVSDIEKEQGEIVLPSRDLNDEIESLPKVKEA